MIASPKMQEYFAKLEKECFLLYDLASEARKKGFDPEETVEITIAKNMAERVIGLISVVAPQIKGSGAAERISDLEKEFGALDWRVAMHISLEVAQEKFCKFKNQLEAMEIGIRVGFAYLTLGSLSAPLEGFVGLELKSRLDGQGQYFCLDFAGPVRAAGRTAAVMCVLVADYIRKNFGFATYDPTEKEIQRCPGELENYHEYVANLQYFPSPEESTFLVKHFPLEITGEPLENREISNANFKDIPRIKTNFVRGGYCLVIGECFGLNSPKVWGKMKSWAKEFGMDHWSFLDEFAEMQKKLQAKGGATEQVKLSPNYSYLKDIVAGRPVFGFPLHSGAFRLRYGRARTGGLNGQGVHPATMVVLDGFIASGTQLKVERPGKAASYTSCDSIDGPIVKLKDGSVVFLKTEKLAKEVKDQVLEILYLGDVLICYGDFYDRSHPLAPPGYCPEFWRLELEKAMVDLFGTLDLEKVSDLTKIPVESLDKWVKNPMKAKISLGQAIELSRKLNVPLHPSFTFFWDGVSRADVKSLLEWMRTLNLVEDPFRVVLPMHESKRILEILGVPHLCVNNEFVVLESEVGKALLFSLGVNNSTDVLERLRTFPAEESGLEVINKICPVKLRAKGGTFVGARMGRPEKAKMRKLTGSPHVLFPVGGEGGKLRSFQAAMESGKVTADFSIFYCNTCKRDMVWGVCLFCGDRTVRKSFCKTCGVVDSCPHVTLPARRTSVPIKEYFDALLKKLNTRVFPDLIKGVRGTSNKEHIPEHLLKGLLRAKHSICVNKDGTIRYDCSEVALTHFKPKEVGVSVEKLKSLGYELDCKGLPLEQENQVLELKVQDVVLPCCITSGDEGADRILLRAAKFVDELLVNLYGLPPFYKMNTRDDLIGHQILGLAPHTSAAMLGRIVGFSQTQTFLAHPYFHCAMRRDADGDEACFLLVLDAFLNFSKKYLPESRGSKMDAPLVVTYQLNPNEVDDQVFNMDIAWHYPLAMYLAALEFKSPKEVKIRQVASVLKTEEQFEGLGYTHETSDFNGGVLCSAYKLLPSMQDKLKGQMDLAVKIRAVDAREVATLVIERHFIRDTKGNLRKFSQQEFRCVGCNEKFRRPPLIGKCTKCSGKLLFTISEGSIIKYLEPSISLANKYGVSTYLKQTLELTKRRIESVFGRESEKQEELGKWFG
ncbi:MAG: DNA polymerase II large subunit [Nanoarchaeota archaeon]